MHPIGRLRGRWNNPGYGPQSFQKVGTGNKWFEYFNLNKDVGRNEKYVIRFMQCVPKSSVA
jgi:hypothetical protein